MNFSHVMGAAVLLGAMVALSACSSRQAEIEDEFMSACLSQNDSRLQKRLCQCVLDSLQHNRSAEEFVTYAETNQAQLMREAVKHAVQCSTGR